MVFLVLVAVLSILLFVYDKYKLRYWDQRGVKCGPSVPLFGHFLPVVLTTKGAGNVYTELYRLFNNERYFGAYEFHRPVLVLRDTKLIQDVLVKDFSHFSDHPNWIFDDNTFLKYSVLRLNGNLWRAVRYKFTPSFTANKMETAFKRLLASATISIKEGVQDTREILNIYAADAIASYFATTIADKDQFQKVIRKQFDMPVSRYIEILIVEHFPKLAKLVGAQFIRSDLNKVYEEIMKELAGGPSEFRKMMLEILSEKDIEMKAKDFNATGEGGNLFKYEATYELMLGQVAQFVVGGLDTTSNTMAFIAYDLATHPETQKTARSQIREVLTKYGGQWTYEGVKELTYLQNVIYESTRLHPVLPFLFRDVTKDYTLDDGLSLKRGDKIVIPSFALQTDPNFYPEPEKFIPERWEGIEEARNNYTWLPFGDGPRICLGMRFAFMEMKFAFAKILHDYDLSLSDEQPNPPKIHPRTFLSQIDGPLLINFKKL